MIGKEIAVKKYVVRLSAEERAQLDEAVRALPSPSSRPRGRTGCDGSSYAASATSNVHFDTGGEPLRS